MHITAICTHSHTNQMIMNIVESLPHPRNNFKASKNPLARSAEMCNSQPERSHCRLNKFCQPFKIICVCVRACYLIKSSRFNYSLVNAFNLIINNANIALFQGRIKNAENNFVVFTFIWNFVCFMYWLVSTKFRVARIFTLPKIAMQRSMQQQWNARSQIYWWRLRGDNS